MDKLELWQAVLARLQFQVSQANFATWFKQAKIAQLQDGQLVIAAPNKFSRDWLADKFNKQIAQVVRELAPEVRELKYVVEKTAPKQAGFAAANANTKQLNLHNLINEQETGLNPRYCFENFIVGSFNELAHAAAKGVAEKPGSVYNPLFLYGGVGLGKTHLLQAIGNRLQERLGSRPQIFYLTCEKFTSEMVKSIQNNTIQAFKEKYRAADLLIIDDIQFLSGREKTQEEFFHVFNILYQQNKQIVLSSDRPPKEISALEARLRSRFEGGMIADISTVFLFFTTSNFPMLFFVSL